MGKIWIAADSIVSPLGSSSEDNFQSLRKGISAIENIDDAGLSAVPFFGSKLKGFELIPEMTLLESITCKAIEKVLDVVKLPLDRTLLILSTTKGNISLLDEGNRDHPRIHLHAMADFVATKFGFPRNLVVSNACISGLMALLVGKRSIESGAADHVVVVGVDVLSRFVVSGFQSLHALSPQACRPFDAERQGLNLGECSTAVVITGKPEALDVVPSISIAGGGFSNDANHISGPSRTGEELAFAIQQAMSESNVTRDEIDFISAHGTATLYNDEMEAKAFALQGFTRIPTHSLKGYYGHTLGAAGVLEVVLSASSLRHNELIPSMGFEKIGVSQPLSIIRHLEKKPLNICLKTASGFGGCNAAIILRKEHNN
ncbi:MAG: beta-ketoacyl synthase N-terminal-like domain-containing protein [Chryseolinea sp.]